MSLNDLINNLLITPDQKYTATHEIDDAVLFTEDKHISQAEKKRRLAELTRALAVMGIRPSSFYAFHTKGQTEQV